MKNKIILIFIFLLAFILRFYQLGNIPLGLQQDETSIGYNAYSILLTGKDEYGLSYPLYFKAFGEYKLPLYIYLSVIPVKLFDLNSFSVRFVAALFGFLTVFVFYFFVKDIFINHNRNLPMVATLFLALNPWHLFFSRGAFEVTPALFFIITGLFVINKSLSKNREYLLPFGIVIFFASIYTYNIARLFSPILFIVLIYELRHELLIKSKKILSISSIALFLSLLPFILNIFTKGGLEAAKGTLIFSSAVVQAPLLEFRSYFLGYPLQAKLFFNSFFLTLWQYINNIISYMSVPFLFIDGSMHGNHGIGNFGQFYIFELPLIFFGIMKILKDKNKWGYFMLIWSSIVILVASLTREVPQATRSFFLIIPFEIFSAFGLLILIDWVKKIKNFKYQFALATFFILFAFYDLIFYFSSYYVRFPILYAKSWRLEDKDLSLYIKQNEYKYNRIIFDNNAGFIYTSYLFYSKYFPLYFQISQERYPDDSEGFAMVQSFGKFEFKNIDWSNDYKEPKTLIVTTPDKKPDNISPLKIFYYPRRPVYFAVKQKVVGYPIEEIAYVLVETK